jgi:hypothetical protein
MVFQVYVVELFLFNKIQMEIIVCFIKAMQLWNGKVPTIFMEMRFDYKLVARTALYSYYNRDGCINQDENTPIINYASVWEPKKKLFASFSRLYMVKWNWLSLIDFPIFPQSTI